MDRPRRTTRQPLKSYKILTASHPATHVTRRKADPEQRLNALLENSKSELALMDLSVRTSPAFEVSFLGNVSSCDHAKLQVLNGHLP